MLKCKMTQLRGRIDAAHEGMLCKKIEDARRGGNFRKVYKVANEICEKGG